MALNRFPRAFCVSHTTPELATMRQVRPGLLRLPYHTRAGDNETGEIEPSASPTPHPSWRQRDKSDRAFCVSHTTPELETTFCVSHTTPELETTRQVRPGLLRLPHHIGAGDNETSQTRPSASPTPHPSWRQRDRSDRAFCVSHTTPELETTRQVRSSRWRTAEM